MKVSLKNKWIGASMTAACLLATTGVMAQSVYKIGVAGPMTGGIAA